MKIEEYILYQRLEIREISTHILEILIHRYRKNNLCNYKYFLYYKTTNKEIRRFRAYPGDGKHSLIHLTIKFSEQDWFKSN